MTTITELASIYDNFIFDCDGVLWQADEQIGDAFKTIEWLEEQGKIMQQRCPLMSGKRWSKWAILR